MMMFVLLVRCDSYVLSVVSSIVKMVVWVFCVSCCMLVVIVLGRCIDMWVFCSVCVVFGWWLIGNVSGFGMLCNVLC